MKMELIIRFDYGHIMPWVRKRDGGLEAIAGPDALILRTPVETHGEDLTTVAEFTVAEGDRVPFVLTWFASHEEPPRAINPEHALRETEEYWTRLGETMSKQGPWREAVVRSLITLKGLTYAPDRRHRRGGDDFVAGRDRRRAQLGLSLLLVARRDFHADRADGCRLSRGSACVARMALARGRRQRGANADHVWRARASGVSRNSRSHG